MQWAEAKSRLFGRAEEKTCSRAASGPPGPCHKGWGKCVRAGGNAKVRESQRRGPGRLTQTCKGRVRWKEHRKQWLEGPRWGRVEWMSRVSWQLGEGAAWWPGVKEGSWASRDPRWNVAPGAPRLQLGDSLQGVGVNPAFILSVAPTGREFSESHLPGVS